MKLFFKQKCAALWTFLEDNRKALQADAWKRNGTLEIGKHTYGQPRIMQYRGSERKVRIGSYCSIAPDVTIISGGIHPVSWVSTFPFRIKWKLPGAYTDGMPCSSGDVNIGSDVWIGTHVIILSGVTIGHGAVIATGAVVTKDVPPYTLAGGVPAKIIRKRFTEDQITSLLCIRWWEWDEEKIKTAAPLLSSDNMDEFIRLYSK